MRVARFVAVSVALLACAGCYNAAFPLDAEPQADLDPALLGTWACLPADPGDDVTAVTLRVERARERVYRLTFEAPGEQPDAYQAHVSLLAGEPLLNVRDTGPRAGNKPWIFARYRLTRPHLLEVQIASEEGLEGVETTSVAVRAAWLKRRDEPGVFEELLVCVRRKPRSTDGTR